MFADMFFRNISERAVLEGVGAGVPAPEAALGRGRLYARSFYDAAPACGPEGPAHRDPMPGSSTLEIRRCFCRILGDARAAGGVSKPGASGTRTVARGAGL